VYLERGIELDFPAEKFQDIADCIQ
jgi:hypothetical protein